MEQPKKSKIKITRTDDTLEIYIPPARFRSYMTIVILGMEFIFSFPILLMAYGVYAAEFPYKVVCAAFSIPFLAGAIGMGAFLPHLLFASTYINIDLKQIKIASRMFGSEIDTPLVILRENLEKIKRTERHTVVINPGNKYTAQAIDERADIVFQAGTDEHSIRFYTSMDLPDTELDWLAFEISNFLKLPITNQFFQIA
ncbi:MAG: hypothetical protein HC930_01445 [Hydrococcus sp. SU_1_0]|nr:hypothetical protein [Hydrococcus sp. SU_1_0]